MVFEAFERRLGERLDAAFHGTAKFNAAWHDLKRTLVEPMLQTAVATLRGRHHAFDPVCQSHEGKISLYVNYQGQTHRLQFAPNQERREIECGVVRYPQGGQLPSEAGVEKQFFALQELSHLALERIVLEYADGVVRTMPSQ
jgi:hypothetical protein